MRRAILGVLIPAAIAAGFVVLVNWAPVAAHRQGPTATCSTEAGAVVVNAEVTAVVGPDIRCRRCGPRFCRGCWVRLEPRP